MGLWFEGDTYVTAGRQTAYFIMHCLKIILNMFSNSFVSQSKVFVLILEMKYLNDKVWQVSPGIFCQDQALIFYLGSAGWTIHACLLIFIKWWQIICN